jgi:hypothetical protein
VYIEHWLCVLSTGELGNFCRFLKAEKAEKAASGRLVAMQPTCFESLLPPSTSAFLPPLQCKRRLDMMPLHHQHASIADMIMEAY